MSNISCNKKHVYVPIPIGMQCFNNNHQDGDVGLHYRVGRSAAQRNQFELLPDRSRSPGLALGLDHQFLLSLLQLFKN